MKMFKNFSKRTNTRREQGSWGNKGRKGTELAEEKGLKKVREDR